MVNFYIDNAQVLCKVFYKLFNISELHILHNLPNTNKMINEISGLLGFEVQDIYLSIEPFGKYRISCNKFDRCKMRNH